MSVAAAKREPVAIAAVVRAAVLVAVAFGFIENEQVEQIVAGVVIVVEAASAYFVRSRVTPTEEA